MKKYTTIPHEVILSALDKLDAYIRPTYGPAGRGILVDAGSYPKMLDDGFMAIDEFELDDPLENAVIKLVKAASFQANKRAGDGTTTATLLMIAIVREGIKSGKSLWELLTELSVGSSEAIGAIFESKRDIDSAIDLYQVAFNAYRDSGSAAIVGRVVKEVGADGVITVEGSEALETKSEVVMGMSIASGFSSPYLANEEGKVELVDPLILVTTRRIQTNKELLPIVERVIATGKKQLFIVCEDMQGEALTTMIMNRLRGNLDVMVVRAPFYDVERKTFLEDLAAITGATLVDDTLGFPLEQITVGALGKADKVVVTKEDTIVVGGKGDTSVRVSMAQKDIAEQPNNDAFKARLARLTGGIGVIKVGAGTEAEIITKKAKVDDAVHATQLAYKTGVVAGGARALMVHTSSDELNKALCYPRAVLEANGSSALDDTSEDAFGVVESAIESAVSIASLLLNCGGIITKIDGTSSK